MTYKMRQIVLKDLREGDDGVVEDANYANLLRVCLEAPENPQVGCTTAETRKVAPILDQLDNVEAGGTIQVTESQWANIKSRIKNMKMNSNRRVMVRFEDDIAAAKEIDMVPAEADRDGE